MECNGIQWHVFGKERYIKQINDIQDWQKKTAEFHRSTKVMSKKNWDYDTAEEGGGSRHFFDR